MERIEIIRGAAGHGTLGSVELSRKTSRVWLHAAHSHSIHLIPNLSPSATKIESVRARVMPDRSTMQGTHSGSSRMVASTDSATVESHRAAAVGVDGHRNPPESERIDLPGLPELR